MVLNSLFHWEFLPRVLDYIICMLLRFCEAHLYVNAKWCEQFVEAADCC